jgi:uncharacterized protein (DUF924 family)
MKWVGDVLHFWFDELAPRDWFSGEAAVDRMIGARFAALRQALKENPPPVATLDPDGCVASVIVFDQFSRNLFRGAGEAFATDRLALDYASRAIARGLDAALTPPHRDFLYMPFMHAENMESQDRSVALFARLGRPDLLKYAVEHRSVIGRFGRFPARNEALGRLSTPAERDYLESIKRRNAETR